MVSQSSSDDGPLIEEVPQAELTAETCDERCAQPPYDEDRPVPRGPPVSLGPPAPKREPAGAAGPRREPLRGAGAAAPGAPPQGAGGVAAADGGLRSRTKARMQAVKQRLQAAALEPQQAGAASEVAAEQRPEFFIAGSWDDWAPHRMAHDEGSGRCRFTLQLGKAGRESFQIWLDADCNRCLHPDRADASIHSELKLCGPDARGHGKNWTIGKHTLDSAAHGVCYDVRLHLDSVGRATAVDWVRLGVFGQASDHPYWIAGSWDRWAQHRMRWDAGRRCYHTNVLLGSTGMERFQISVHADWGRRLYPPRDSASCHSCRELCGPDDGGHGKNWVIGAHPLDDASEGLCYEVRLHLKKDGSPGHVDWVKLSAPAEGRGGKARPREPHLPCDDGGGAAVGEVGLSGGEALRQYRQRISENLESLRYAELQSDLAARDLEARRLCGQAPLDGTADPDAGEWPACCHCGLPVGDFGYARDGSGDLAHGECYAQLVLQDLRAEERLRLEEEAVVKLAKRKEFSIGWAAERVPSGLSLADKLHARPMPQGLHCLVLDEGSQSVRVAATMEPAAAVNLEYLALALQVRLLTGRELMFSLDPLCPEAGSEDDCRSWTQVKRFIPDWMAGTSMGDILFQADYHLKELSMGEYEQPVLGLRSCFDLVAEGEGFQEAWNAREWFVIKKAAIHLSEDDVLIPYVQMGVEAREQIQGPHGLEDKGVTRADHPLVRFAEGFSKSFDLIAERKSVIYHLREAAKASVLAKFLIEDRVQLDEAWFSADVENSPCLMEIPQLWNERGHSQISVRDGVISNGDGAVGMRMFRVYGGVDFGLGGLSRPRAAGALRGVDFGLDGLSRRRTGPLRASITARALEQWRPAALATQSGLKGVDFDSGMFDLSTPIRCSGRCLASEGEATVAGGAFWSSLDDDAPAGDDGYTGLLRAVFNPHLSDRRAEGERFTPPGTSLCYLQKIRELVREEETLRQRRKDLFLSADFSEENPGELFPASWRPTIGLASGGSSRKVSAAPPGSLLQARPDCKARAELFRQLLHFASPAFERSTEEGLRFRIYRIGSLEVRTTQEHDGEEVLGAFFSFRGSGQPQADVGQGHRTRDSDWIVKATQYVERASDAPPPSARALAAPRERLCHYYVVLETEQENMIVMERLEDGDAVWQEGPLRLDDRNSFAKVLRCADCHLAGVTVGDMKAHHAAAPRLGTEASEAECRRHAEAAFDRASGPAGAVERADELEHDGWKPWSRSQPAAPAPDGPLPSEPAPAPGGPRPEPAADSRAAESQEWRVVHRRAFLRAEPSPTARLSGREAEGAVLRGVPEEVGGTTWLRVEVPGTPAPGGEERTGDQPRAAWMLIHGGLIGLGPLLEPGSGPPDGKGAQAPGPAPRRQRGAHWACPFCEELNRAGRASCNNCGQACPQQPPRPGEAAAHWLCGACGEPNRAERAQCNNCGQARPPTAGAPGCAGAASAAPPWPAGRPAPFKLFIAGTWRDFSPEEMRWDGGVYAHAVTVGSACWESFQLLINGSWDAAFYPSVADANPFEQWRLCGPDAKGHGKNWQIGKKSVEAVAVGSRFVILVGLTADGSVGSVNWRLLSGG